MKRYTTACLLAAIVIFASPLRGMAQIFDAGIPMRTFRSTDMGADNTLYHTASLSSYNRPYYEHKCWMHYMGWEIEVDGVLSIGYGVYETASGGHQAQQNGLLNMAVGAAAIGAGMLIEKEARKYDEQHPYKKTQWHNYNYRNRTFFSSIPANKGVNDIG